MVYPLPGYGPAKGTGVAERGGVMKLRLWKLAALVSLAGCSSVAADQDGTGSAVVTADRDVYDFHFRTKVTAPVAIDVRKAIHVQLLYATGELTTYHVANANVGQAELLQVDESPVTNGERTISYEARLQVLFPTWKKPESYELVLPSRVDERSLRAFNARYDGPCNKHMYGQDSFWHDFLPRFDSCPLKDPAKRGDDVVSAIPRVSPSQLVTSDRMPDYKRIWDDGLLHTLVVLGVTDGGLPETEALAAGIVNHVSTGLGNPQKKAVSGIPGIIGGTSLQGEARPGRKVSIDVVITESMGAPASQFSAWLKQSSSRADYVVYSGHSGLGANIQSFLRVVTPARGQYQVMFLDGCNTYQYMDNAAQDIRAKLNADDPHGTLYLDQIANVLPAWTDKALPAIANVYDVLVHDDAPKTYNELVRGMPDPENVVVTGELDNPKRAR